MFGGKNFAVGHITLHINGLSLLSVCRHNGFCVITLVLVDNSSKFLTKKVHVTEYIL